MQIRKYTGVFDYYPEEQFLEPKPNSTVIIKGYWIKTGTEFMRDKRTGVWQYHVRKELAERISSELPGTSVHYMDYCYVPNNPTKEK